MVVMPVLALFLILIGLGSASQAAEPVAERSTASTVSVRPANAGAAASGASEALSLESDQPTIIEFSASWCGPCKEMKPQVDLLKTKNYPIRVLDVDQHADLAKNYRVGSVPTFVIVDPDGKELGRSEGLQPAGKLASAFRQLKSEWIERTSRKEVAAEDIPENEDVKRDLARMRAEENAAVDEGSPAPGSGVENPKPWETVVRIVVHGGGVMGFGSGTIIHSNENESLILTCAHIFKIDGAHQQHAPKSFPRQVTVDLFDGRLAGPKGQTVATAVRNIPARVIDYDFQSDVGLIVISPGYKLPASPVVPSEWKPTPKMLMYTAGCSGGRDATIWNTEVVNPESRLLLNNKPYEAVECLHEPIQGRSGGGLFTMDGFVAGVCDMAVVGGKRGLYATPRSIHTLLARNNLDKLYKRQLQDIDNGRMLASADSPRSRRPSPRVERAQDDDSDEVTLPPPNLLGVTDPASAGLPPAGSLAMVDRMTDQPLKTVPHAGTGWNGVSRFRKISESAEVTAGMSIPKRTSSTPTLVAQADGDLVPVNQLTDEDSDEPAAMNSKPKIKTVANPETALADGRDSTRAQTRKASRDPRQAPRVRLMPVQDLESAEGDDNTARAWRGDKGR
jgi:thiol-disulfide isomerase/thioredoxin